MAKTRRKPGRKSRTPRVEDTIRTMVRENGGDPVVTTYAEIATLCGHHGGEVHPRTVGSAMRELIHRGAVEMTRIRHGIRVEVVR